MTASASVNQSFVVMSFDHLDSSHFKSTESIFIRSQTRLQLQKIDNPSTVEKFLADITAFYMNGVIAIKKSMSIGDKVLKLTAILKPENRISSEPSDIVPLAKHFPQI